MSVLRQIAPARAKQKILEPKVELTRLRGPDFFAEEKKDGIRELLHTGTGWCRITSRRQSVHDGLFVEKTDCVPHIRDLTALPGWVVDGEVVSRWGETSHQRCANTVSVMGSNPAQAVALQRKHGWCTFEVFDVLVADGEDIRGRPLKKRLEFLDQFLDETWTMTSGDLRYREQYGDPCNHLFRMRSVPPGADFAEFYERIMAEKGEGLVLKDLTKPYNHARAWFKWKHRFDMDVVLTGQWEPAKYGKTGKFDGLGGAFYFGVYKEGRLVPLGKCSGMDDATRERMTQMAVEGTLAGRVIQISGYEVTKAGLIRNPNFERWRSDKLAAECTFETQVVPNTRW